MTRPPDDNTPPDVPHAPGTDTDPHRGEVSESRPDLLRRLLDTLGWESGTDEQALEALADAVRVARGGRMGKDVHQQRNEARAECERLRRELQAMVGARGLTMEQVLYRVRIELAHRDRLLCQRNEARAECERLQRELREAREAVGERWFAGGVSLAQAIKRKVRVLEERRPEDPVLTCARCGPTPHRWRPSPEAGPHWRCSECGEITGPEGGAR